MADISASRTAQPAILLRLETQQGKHMIDISAPCTRAAQALPHYLDQAGAEPVARFLRRDQKYLSRDIAGCSPRDHADKPVTKRPAASAASITACGSTTIVLPATIAIPASFAAAAPSTVRG